MLAWWWTLDIGEFSMELNTLTTTVSWSMLASLFIHQRHNIHTSQSEQYPTRTSWCTHTYLMVHTHVRCGAHTHMAWCTHTHLMLSLIRTNRASKGNLVHMHRLLSHPHPVHFVVEFTNSFWCTPALNLTSINTIQHLPRLFSDSAHMIFRNLLVQHFVQMYFVKLPQYWLAAVLVPRLTF